MGSPGNSHYLPSLTPVPEAITNGSSALCDGSFKDKFGTSVFYYHQWQRVFLGLNVVPGHPRH
jgi:hypothetical protein